MSLCFTGGPKILSLRVLPSDEQRRWVEVFKALGRFAPLTGA
jgi:hypothetical protein